MKPKQPWKPPKPKQAKRCPLCKGSGKTYEHNIFGWSSFTDARDCRKCGGKGYL